jgi:hypothetical protein
MAIVNIGNQPELTPDQAREVFAQHFAGKYEIVKSNAIKRNFIVKKSGWVGVGVRLKQERTGTSFVFTGLMPNVMLQVLFGGIASYLWLRSSWKELEGEVAEFIANEPSFQQPAPARIEKLAA